MFCINRAKLEFMGEIRALWEQHGTWTMMAITSIVFRLPNETNVVQRLLRNPVDFRRALAPFYGEIAAANFERLLAEHLTLAADLIKAIMAGDTNSAAIIERRWYRNAEEIAVFLSSINPFWSRDAWRNMLFEHLGYVKSIAVNMINGNYAASVRVSDDYEAQILEMAEMMSQGIIRQFPRKFTSLRE